MEARPPSSIINHVRKEIFAKGEYYHIYNRGVDKRNIFEDKLDLYRFLQSMEEFNVLEPIGSLYENSFLKKKAKLGGQASKSDGKLVNIICYCLNPNHFHFLLEQVEDKGVEKFIQRLGTGYVRFFNDKYKRSGSLFQGPYKASHIDGNTYLLHVSAYVNLNDRVHQLGGQVSKLVESRSSWGEYVGVNTGSKILCKKDIILEQFKDKKEYAEFAKESVQDTLRRREKDGILRSLTLE